jgi:membrane protease YdiL (CAAX protease family)
MICSLNWYMQRLVLPVPIAPTIGFALAWLALMLAYSPLADRIATRLVSKPPTLGAFGVLQQSRSKLLVGIIVAWVFGGFLEELIFRGIILQSIKRLLSPLLVEPMATGIAVCIAAIGAGIVHLYQGPRAAIIITQLSVLFGILFVVSGYNLLAVMLCHGSYDTIAFIRFANKKSKYSKFDGDS